MEEIPADTTAQGEIVMETDHFSLYAVTYTVESYFKTNMDFLKPEVRQFFFKELPDVYSRVDDLPPAKYNAGSDIKNSIVSSVPSPF